MDFNWSVSNISLIIFISFLFVSILLLCVGCYLCWRFDKATYVSNYNYGSVNRRQHNQDFNDSGSTSRTDEDMRRVIQQLRSHSLSLQSTGSGSGRRQHRSQSSSISSQILSVRSSTVTTPRRMGSVHVSPFHIHRSPSPGFIDDEDGLSSYTSDVGSLHLDDLPNYDAVSSEADQQSSIQDDESLPSYADCVALPIVPQLLLSPATPEPVSP